MNRLLLIFCFAMGGGFARPALGVDDTAIAIYSAGIDGMLSDDLDRGLHAVLVSMERNGFQMPMFNQEADQSGIDLFGQILMSRMHLELKINAAEGKPGAFPGSLQLSVFGNSGATVQEMATRINGLMKMRGGPSDTPVNGHPGIMQVDPNMGLEMPPIYWGQTEVGGEDSVTISLNAMPSETAMDLSMFGLPQGVTPMAGLRLNFAAMTPVLAPAMMSGGPEGRLGLKAFEQFGLIGPDAMDVTIACGVDSKESHMAGRITNMLKHWGMLMADEGLSDSDLKVIPQDATAFTVRRIQLAKLPEFINSMADKVMPPGEMPMGPDGKVMQPMDLAVQMTQPVIGIDLVTEFFGYLGETMVVYRSNGTGGGGLFSLTGLIELSNPDGMKKTLSTLASRLNSDLARMSDGHVQLVSWSDEDKLDMLTLAFPELPVPVQVTFGVAGNQMIIGMTPETVRIAASQLESRSSILNNRSFTDARGGGDNNVFEMSYLDAASRLAEGYGFAAGLMTAIGNYSIPKGKPIRAIQPVMPSYADLEEGAKPTLVMSMLDQDDMVIKGTSARSMMVHATSLLGELVTSPLLVAAVGTGLLLPAVAQARNTAKLTQNMANLRDISVAAHTWSVDHGGKLPDSLDDLVKAGYIKANQITGHMEYYGKGVDIAQLKHPSQTIMAAMFVNDDIPAVFMDGHVRNLSYQEYEAHLNIQMPHGE
ncbi:MAG: hypothetical protein CMJ39_09335 [Phycisphaerae bacterium]|nr:hypothetical protein [Phycisphaerae bacterium]